MKDYLTTKQLLELTKKKSLNTAYRWHNGQNSKGLFLHADKIKGELRFTRKDVKEFLRKLYGADL